MALMTLTAVVLLACAFYAHVMLPSHVAGRRKLMLTRGILIVVGAGFGLVVAATHANDPAAALLGGLIGFGAVHFPAAFILLFKHARGSGKS